MSVPAAEMDFFETLVQMAAQQEREYVLHIRTLRSAIQVLSADPEVDAEDELWSVRRKVPAIVARLEKEGAKTEVDRMLLVRGWGIIEMFIAQGKFGSLTPFQQVYDFVEAEFDKFRPLFETAPRLKKPKVL